MEISIAIIISSSYHCLLGEGSGDRSFISLVHRSSEREKPRPRNQTKVVSSAPRSKLDVEILDLKLESDAIMNQTYGKCILCTE